MCAPFRDLGIHSPELAANLMSVCVAMHIEGIALDLCDAFAILTLMYFRSGCIRR